MNQLRSVRRRVRRGRRDGESGQAIILGVFTMFILAVMLMMSFNVSQAVHERVSIQHHADAVAYSTATMQARAFNYFAYSNRALAASYASMATLHAYMSSTNAVHSMLEGARQAYMVIAVLEFLLSFCFTPWPVPCCNFQHCQHSIEAAQVANAYGREANSFRDIRDALREDYYVPATEELMRMINGIHQSQISMVNHTLRMTGPQGLGVIGGFLGLGVSPVIDALSDNAPRARVNAAVASTNRSSFACAIDEIPGMPGQDRADCGERGATPLANQKRVMWEVVQGTTPEWTHSRPLFPYHIHPELMQRLMYDIPEPRGGTTVPIVADSRTRFQDPTGETDTIVDSRDSGIILTVTDCIPFLWSFDGRESSSDWDQDAHGFDMPGEDSDEERAPFQFVKFRPDIEAFRDAAIGPGASYYGQPSVYAAVSQDVSRMRDGSHGPWEINQSARVEVEHGAQGQARFNLTPSQDAVAVSKAVVYYHQPPPGDWEEQPNFFNPYWRAKLHPFEGGEEYISLTTYASLGALRLPIDGLFIWPATRLIPPGGWWSD